MPDTNTVVAALKFKGGVIIGSDSQVSDRVVRVRWPIEKLEQIGQHPLVIGFSDSGGAGQRAYGVLNSAGFQATTFKKPERVQAMIDGRLLPLYEQIHKMSNPPGKTYPEIGLTGLAAFWAAGKPHVLEREMNGDSFFHDYFHAIGSGGNTAYAVFRTLGGPRLVEIEEGKAIWALLRIIRTAIYVEVTGVSEPITVFVIRGGKVEQLVKDQIDAEMQAVVEWELEDQDRFLTKKA